MMSEGTFPFPRDEVALEEAPRVADGVILLDDQLRIRFTSPNAISSLHRLGIHAYTPELLLGDIGFDQDAAEAAFRLRVPVTEEIERGETSVLIQAIPLLERGRSTGAMILVRDVTDLRRRDRILLSKDATIREIHHRVKNNLQTIAALLRLQGRRLQSPEAQEAIQESERRIRSIAIVHETLSRDAADVVEFAEIIGPLVRVVEETVSTPELRLHFDVDGNAGQLPGEIATPLAVVLNELMQNAVDHAFPETDDGLPSEGHVRVDRPPRGRRAGPRGRRRRRRPARPLLPRRVPRPRALDRPRAGDERARRVDRDARRPRHAGDPAGPPARWRPDRARDAVARRLGYEAARWRATQALRSLRRSSSVVPPQMPASWLVASANSRHSSVTWQAVQIRRAVSICSSAGPVVPMGKKTSGSESRHAESGPPGFGVPVVGTDPGKRHLLFLRVIGTSPW